MSTNDTIHIIKGVKNMAYVIGVDCGTSGTKTVLFDERALLSLL